MARRRKDGRRLRERREKPESRTVLIEWGCEAPQPLKACVTRQTSLPLGQYK